MSLLTGGLHHLTIRARSVVRMVRWWSPPVSSDICVVLSGARARDVPCYFVCESRELTQKIVQVSRQRFDDDAIDTSFAVVLYSVEDCVGVALERGLRVTVGNEASDAGQHAHRHLELRPPAELVDLGDGFAHLLWRSPEAVPAVTKARRAPQCCRTIASDQYGDARRRSRSEEHIGIVDVRTVKLGRVRFEQPAHGGDVLVSETAAVPEVCAQKRVFLLDVTDAYRQC